MTSRRGGPNYLTTVLRRARYLQFTQGFTGPRGSASSSVNMEEGGQSLSPDQERVPNLRSRSKRFPPLVTKAIRHKADMKEEGERGLFPSNHIANDDSDGATYYSSDDTEASQNETPVASLRFDGAVLRFPLRLRSRMAEGRRRRSVNEILVVPMHCARKLLVSSQLTFFSVFLALYNWQWDCAALAVTVLICSILYWSYPVLGMRRNVDIACACSAIFYQLGFKAPELYSSGQFDMLYAYLALTGMGVACYALARYTGGVLHNPDVACLWHVGLHIFGNLSNAVLYTALGRIARASPA